MCGFGEGGHGGDYRAISAFSDSWISIGTEEKDSQKVLYLENLRSKGGEIESQLNSAMAS